MKGQKNDVYQYPLKCDQQLAITARQCANDEGMSFRAFIISAIADRIIKTKEKNEKVRG